MRDIPQGASRGAYLGPDEALTGVVGHAEPELFANVQHRAVLGQNIADDPADPLVTRNLKQTAQQLRTESLSLIPVTHNECEFGGAAAVKLRQPPYGNDFPHSV